MYRHYEFRQKLALSAKQYEGVHVVVLPEEWTSKTCSRCKHIHHDLGANKQFECPHCGLVIDRDCNAVGNLWEEFLREVLHFPLEPLPLPASLARNSRLARELRAKDASSTDAAPPGPRPAASISPGMGGDQEMPSAPNRGEVPPGVDAKASRPEGSR